MALRVFGVVLAIAVSAVAATAQDAKPVADPARLAAARDLMDVIGVTKQMDLSMETMKNAVLQGAKTATPELKEKFAAEFDKSAENMKAYRNDMITDFAALYAETFTAEEMKAVADFYRTGPGAKFIQMSPELMQKGAAIGMRYSTKVMDEMRRATPAEQPK